MSMTFSKDVKATFDIEDLGPAKTPRSSARYTNTDRGEWQREHNRCKGKRQFIGGKIPSELAATVYDIAEERGCTLTEILIVALTAYCKEWRRKHG